MSRTLGRIRSHRQHLLKNLGRSLVRSERLTTTLPKAKELQRLVERWVSLAKRVQESSAASQLAGRRRLIAQVIELDVVRKLVDDLAVRVKTRTGGYTRILHLGHRLGDAAPVAQIEFVDRPAVKAATRAKSARTAQATPVAPTATRVKKAA
ncbi:50S ribosomal protein L17 [Candidatus Berkelbacteria bacterium]|nr:50S ribosomal protein L17 [Candidatus Berkelbacteria bacterium]